MYKLMFYPLYMRPQATLNEFTLTEKLDLEERLDEYFAQPGVNPILYKFTYSMDKELVES